IYYYITVMNENYPHPAMPDGAEEGIVRGMYLLRSTGKKENRIKVSLMGSGAILREVEAAAEMLDAEHDVSADIWSVTSFNELARDGQAVARHNALHPQSAPRQSFVAMCLDNSDGPVIAATDYIRLYAEQIRAFVPRRYYVLGTDGFGRSDTRAQLRKFFEVDRSHVVVQALYALVEAELLAPAQCHAAIEKYAIDADRPHPATL
ncbi:MAG: pyruvate dehydrogenase (acetyl-transferring), homodimeric type, partial [Gammaproteobacteria bacterium]|nr:pyruvate dehydrogenase (acetyl-transferring), homodimeric type [Gammaproteobacteria bacterium]